MAGGIGPQPFGAQRVVQQLEEIPLFVVPCLPVEVQHLSNPRARRSLAADDDPWLATATCVDADVDAPEVESVVHKLAKNRLNSSDTVFSMTKSTVQTTDFLWQLVWWVDFLYSGEAHPGGEGEFFVALAGHDDAVLEEAHPSALRAVTARVRKVLSFDMSGFAGMRKRP